jgi:hypothetical protein
MVPAGTSYPQQAEVHAQILDLRFAWSTNGHGILVDDPKDKVFAPFGDARHKIENGDIKTPRC